MMEKGIILLSILRFVVSALSLDEAAILQLITNQYNNQADSETKLSLNQNNPQSKTTSVENYEALTHQLAGLNDNLMNWLYDDKVDELIHHLEALEKLTRDHGKDFHFDLNADSEETEEDKGKTPRSEVNNVPNCALGKICLEVQIKEVDEHPEADFQATVSHKNSASSDSEGELIYTGDSDSSPEASVEASTKETTSTTLATTTTDKDVPKGENHNDLDEWIPYSFLNELIKANATIQPGGNIVNNKKFARVDKLIFEDSLPKVKESNEYDVKDIKQLIITNSARGEPTGIIVAENRKFSLDYIDLEDLRTHNDNITSDDKQSRFKLQKALNSNSTDTLKEFRKSSKKVKKAKKPVLRTHSEKDDNSNVTESIRLRTIAQQRKAQRATAKKRLAERYKKKKKYSSDSSDKSNDSDDREATPLKQSESRERHSYMPKRFQVAKSTQKKKAKKKKAPVSSPEDKSTQTLEALSKEIAKKKAPAKKLKSKARIPGKPEHYIQNINRVYKEGQDFRRLRMQHFMPKRYHWDPSEFSTLGFLWFNGHQGKNPPTNYRIAY